MEASINIEAEIAELSRQIEEKRRSLEETRGITVEHKEAIREMVAEKLFFSAPPVASAGSQTTSSLGDTTAKTVKGSSYLDSLDPETITRVNELIGLVGAKGLSAAIAASKNEPAFVLDAFHDALVDRLYDELIARDLIKKS